MDALQKLVRRGVLLLCISCCLLSLRAQNRPTLRWQRVHMDTTLYNRPTPQTQAIYDRYAPEMARQMNAVIGYCAEEMTAYRPESPLSNFAADALLTAARAASRDTVDFSVTNFGGLRAPFPKGALRLYDVYSTFPFDNYLCIADLPGETVVGMLERFAKGHVEAVSGMRLTIRDHQLVEVLVNGQALDVNRTYRVATLDFLLSGGDGVLKTQGKTCPVESYPEYTLRNIMLNHINGFAATGREISCPPDGRIKILQ